MIFSGWILPDLYEVKCSSCSTVNGHIEVVKRYLDNLKEVDLKTYEKIAMAFYRESSSLPSLGLDDFAVMQLGWLKINDEPMKAIFYPDNTELEFTIKRYLNIGYYPIVLDSYRKQIEVDVPSKELI